MDKKRVKINGKRHNKNGPAVDDRDGIRMWFIDGKLHREDGPAVVRSDGRTEYWLDDKYVNKTDFNKRISL